MVVRNGIVAVVNDSIITYQELESFTMQAVDVGNNLSGHIARSSRVLNEDAAVRGATIGHGNAHLDVVGLSIDDDDFVGRIA